MAAALRAELAQLSEARAQLDSRLRQGQHAAQGRRGGAPAWHRGGEHAERAPGETRRPLLSSVVVPAGDDADAPPSEAALPSELVNLVHAPKRPLRSEDDNPALKKRNQRMFGALIGTLQKFRQEEGGNTRQEVNAKRTTALQRAEEREREESKRLRELERGEAGEKRRSELLQRHRLAAEIEEKKLRLAHFTWLEQQERLADHLVTVATPPLHFKPARQCAATEEALALRQAAHQAEVERAEARLDQSLAAARMRAAAREAELTGERPAGAAAASEPAREAGENSNAADERDGEVAAANARVRAEAEVSDADCE